MCNSVVAMLVMVLLTPTLVLGADRPLREAAVREGVRLAQGGTAPAGQAGTTGSRKAGGHPVAIGTAIGAGAGAAVGAFSASCSSPSTIEVAYGCGTRPWAGGLLFGAALGAGAGALIGLAFRH